MVKISKQPSKSGARPGKQQAPAGGGGGNVLKTSKGVFQFTMVADGCYIEHKVALRAAARPPACTRRRHLTLFRCFEWCPP